MSPKSNKAGVSYGESDPRSGPARVELPREVNVPRVTRASDRAAAEEGLRVDDEMNELSVNEDAVTLTGSGEGETLPPADDYDDKVAWSYQALQDESRKRFPDLAVSGVSRDDLVARLREDVANDPPADE